MAWYDFLNPVKDATDIIGGVVGSVTGLYDNVASLWGGSSQQKFERHQAEDARNFTHQENALQRDFAKRMWQDTNDYNTATAQKQRLEEAGMNPYVNMENAGTAQSVTPAVGGSAGATTGTKGAADIGNDNVVAASQAAKNLADAERSEEMLPYDKQLSTSNRVLADFQGSKAYQEAVGQELQNAIVSAFGMKEKQMEIQDWTNRLRYGLAMAINEEKRKELITQQVDLLKNQIKLTDEQAKQIHEYVTKYMANDYFTQFGLRSSEMSSNYAQAGYYNTMSEYQKAILQPTIEVLRSQASHNNAAAANLNSLTKINELIYKKDTTPVKYKTLSGKLITVPSYVAGVYREALNGGYVTKKMQKELDRMAVDIALQNKKNNTYYIDNIWEKYCQNITNICNVAGAVSGFIPFAPGSKPTPTGYNTINSTSFNTTFSN